MTGFVGGFVDVVVGGFVEVVVGGFVDVEVGGLIGATKAGVATTVGIKDAIEGESFFRRNV